ncbi:MAG: hypothetical protein MUP66_02330, partial [Candidatus Nanohaloarchaeota archaeon QJJ-5]|nr:hypothetical protein [Candidatus Nanohaloarchaeota archaeon QJJ-5]
AEYRQQVAQKQNEVARLRSYVETLKDDIAELQDQRDRLQDERHAEAMRDDLVQRWKQRAEDYKKQLDDEKNTTANLENRIDRYQMALDFIHDGETVLKIRMDESAVAETEGPIMMVGPHVQAPPPEPVEVVIITAEDDRSYYDEYGVAVLHYQELRGLKLESYYIIDEETVLDAIDTDSETFMDWLETYRDRQ